MSTNSPVQLNENWSNVQDGPFTGGIQNVGNNPVVFLVRDGEAGAPSDGEGGFSAGIQPIPIGLGDTDVLWCRAVGPVGYVVVG